MSACRSRDPQQAALHRAAPALLRSVAREGARKARHRTPVHLRVDHLGARRTTLCVARTAALLPHAAWRNGGEGHGEEVPRHLQRGLHGADGRRTRSHRRRGTLVARGAHREFWEPFQRTLNDDDLDVLIAEAHDLSALATEKCPECGGKLVPKGGFFGPFVACENHPKVCKYTRPIKGEKKPAELTDYKCQECGEAMVVRHGRSGDFLGCSKFPKCRGTRSMPTGVRCPRTAARSPSVAPRSAARRSTAARTIRRATSWCGTSR
jgi:ssDNA-binding Zn-finger/Zn-ribbon topoisomerase 1